MIHDEVVSGLHVNAHTWLHTCIHTHYKKKEDGKSQTEHGEVPAGFPNIVGGVLSSEDAPVCLVPLKPQARGKPKPLCAPPICFCLSVVHGSPKDPPSPFLICS